MLHARAQAVLGRYYAKMKDTELALHHYSSAVEALAQGGDVLATVEISILRRGTRRRWARRGGH